MPPADDRGGGRTPHVFLLDRLPVAGLLVTNAPNVIVRVGSGRPGDPVSFFPRLPCAPHPRTALHSRFDSIARSSASPVNHRGFACRMDLWTAADL